MQLTKEELQGIYDLQQRQALLKEELAALGQAKLNIKLRQVQVEKYFSVNIDLEKAITKEIEEKYGKGNIDLETGEFTPFTTEDTQEETSIETPAEDSTDTDKE